MKIDLEKFVEVYVHESFEVLKTRPSLNSFDERVRHLVSKKMNLSEKFIGHMHHAFHWEFFCENNPLSEYVQAHKNGENNFVRLKTPYKNKDILNLKNLILGKYGEYLRAMISSYRGKT